MAEGFVQAGLHCPKPPRGKESQKSTFEGSPLPFRAKKHQPTSGWHNRTSSSKRKRQTHEHAPRMDSKSSTERKSSAVQKPQQKGRPKGSRANGGKGSKT